MTEREYFDYLEDVFNSAPCNEHLKPVIHVPKRGMGVFTLQIRPDMLHKGGVVHGSTIFKALDDATSVAAMSVTDQMSTLTVSFNISYLRAIVTGTLVIDIAVKLII